MRELQCSYYDSQTIINELSDYLYTPLGPGEIRLVTIFPGSGFDELLLSLSIVKLEEGILPYEALSYAWGQKEPI